MNGNNSIEFKIREELKKRKLVKIRIPVIPRSLGSLPIPIPKLNGDYARSFNILGKNIEFYLNERGIYKVEENTSITFPYWNGKSRNLGNYKYKMVNKNRK